MKRSLSAKRTWKKGQRDGLIEVANVRADLRTADEEKLREVLRTIIRSKRKGLPMEILNDFERVNQKIRFEWMIPQYRVIGEEPIALKGNVEESLTPRTGKILDLGNPPPPYLVPNVQSLTQYEHYLHMLIRKLQDPEWVQALSECSGECGDLVLNYSVRKRRFCSPQCKKRHFKRHSYVNCPGEGGDRIPRSQCREYQADERYSYDECPTCQYYIKQNGEA